MSETVREVCARMCIITSEGDYLNISGDAVKDFNDQILAAHDREIAEKDEMDRIVAQSAQARFDEEMAAKDAEIARLNAAMKPVLECSSASCDVFQGRRCADAIREAKRIMNEFYNGESHN